MTLKPHKLGAGPAAGNYYTLDSAREAKPNRRDDYYAGDGGGTWWSTGESIVRNGAAVDITSFRDLCAGIDPRSGEALVRGAGASHWAGVDLCMTPGKSVSVLWASGTPEQRAVIEAAHRNAVDAALRCMVAEGLVVVRSGAAGIHRHFPDDLIVARFDHFTTREGDPNLHSHCVLMNAALAPAAAFSGRYGNRHLTIDPAGVYEWQRGLGAAFRAHLAQELHRALGVNFREAGEGQWEIAGISQDVLSAFSKRSSQIDDYAGPNASVAQREVAALATRRGKELVPTGDELEARWHNELAALAADPWRDALRYRAQDTDRDHDRDEQERYHPAEIAGDTPVARAASDLYRHHSVIERKDLLQRSLELAGVQGLGIDAVALELAALESSGQLISLGEDGPSRRWTTHAIAAEEASMLRAAARPDERDWIAQNALDAALAAAPHLAEEQIEALRAVADRAGVTIIEAGAGTGKTTLAKALAEAARASGLRVVGLSPSWVAADQLAASTGMPTHAIARWRHDRATGQAAALDDRSLIVFDEAGMVATRDMAAVLTAARDAGAKVVLLGDRRQLASVAGASALRAVSDVVDRAASMSQVRRQQVDWQQAATVAMARGDSETGLRVYHDHGRVAFVAGEQAAQTAAIAQWQALRAEHGEDVPIITRRNADAAALNRLARVALRQEGRLGPDLAELRALDRKGNPTLLRLAVGDLLRFGETLPQHQIRNGNRATVQAIAIEDAGQPVLTLGLEDGRTTILPWQDLARNPLFNRKPTPPRIVHAHAGTAYSVQGRSSAASVLYVAQAIDARETYVALSRHRHDMKIVVEQNRLDALCRQRQADHRMPASSLAIRERLFDEATRYAEKANVVDYVADRVAFMTSGTVGRPRVQSWLERIHRSAVALQTGLAVGKANTGIVRAYFGVTRRWNWSIGDRSISDAISGILKRANDSVQRRSRAAQGIEH